MSEQLFPIDRRGRPNAANQQSVEYGRASRRCTTQHLVTLGVRAPETFPTVPYQEIDVCSSKFKTMTRKNHSIQPMLGLESRRTALEQDNRPIRRNDGGVGASASQGG